MYNFDAAAVAVFVCSLDGYGLQNAAVVQNFDMSPLQALKVVKQLIQLQMSLSHIKSAE